VLDITISPIKDESGGVLNAIFQYVDISERERAEEALRESKERHTMAIRFSSHATCRKPSVWVSRKGPSSNCC